MERLVLHRWLCNHRRGAGTACAGRARTLTLIGLLLVWVLLWQSWHLVAGSHFIVVQLGLVPQAGVIASGLWSNTVYFTLAVWYYESIDRATRSTASLRESELARRSAERWLLELRLGALQARLDPQVLFDTLDEAGRLYKSRPAAAEQLLDALIDYLRHALPEVATGGVDAAAGNRTGARVRPRSANPEGKALELEAVVEQTGATRAFLRWSFSRSATSLRGRHSQAASPRGCAFLRRAIATTPGCV
jgi:hypothetical protein